MAEIKSGYKLTTKVYELKGGQESTFSLFKKHSAFNLKNFSSFRKIQDQFLDELNRNLKKALVGLSMRSSAAFLHNIIIVEVLT